MNYQLHLGDCLEFMRGLPDGAVDAIITDLPYGTTACAWDTAIPFAPMWEVVKRVLKAAGVFVTTASQPFTSAIVMSNPKWFRYSWVWEKQHPTGFLDARRKPLKAHEDILVFCAVQAPYNPQGTIEVLVDNGRKRKRGGVYGGGVPHSAYMQTTGNFPRSVVRFDRSTHNLSHPTQKPVALFEYLIKTYTTAGDTVLDFTMGSGTTGVACMQTGRNFIGCEIDPNYFAIAKKRIEDAAAQPPLLTPEPEASYAQEGLFK